MARIAVVELNETERGLYQSICWNIHEFLSKSHDERIKQLDNMGALTESLFERNAIPEVRVAYFTDPEMNVGGYGKSREQVFEKNGTAGRDIFPHPHFFEYLRYFIHGPDLPKATIDGFCKIIEDDHGTSGMVLDQIKAYVRKEVRDRHLDPSRAADEFFKLAHEIDEPRFAESVRYAAKQVRK